MFNTLSTFLLSFENFVRLTKNLQGSKNPLRELFFFFHFCTSRNLQQKQFNTHFIYKREAEKACQLYLQFGNVVWKKKPERVQNQERRVQWTLCNSTHIPPHTIGLKSLILASKLSVEGGGGGGGGYWTACYGGVPGYGERVDIKYQKICI